MGERNGGACSALSPLEKLDEANSLLEEEVLDQIILQVCTGRSDFSHVPDGSIVIVSSEAEKPLGEFREAYQKLAGRCSVILGIELRLTMMSSLLFIKVLILVV